LPIAASFADEAFDNGNIGYRQLIWLCDHQGTVEVRVYMIYSGHPHYNVYNCGTRPEKVPLAATGTAILLYWYEPDPPEGELNHKIVPLLAPKQVTLVEFYRSI